jgi:hypothetical protein
MLDTERRLQRLERENRWLKRGGALALAAVAAVLLVGQGKPDVLPDLEVKSLTVKDAQGKVRARIGGFEQGSALALFDTASGNRAVLGVWSGPFLGFFDGGDPVLSLALLKDDGTLRLDLHDKLAIKLRGRRGKLVLEDRDDQTVFVAPEK